MKLIKSILKFILPEYRVILSPDIKTGLRVDIIDRRGENYINLRQYRLRITKTKGWFSK